MEKIIVPPNLDITLNIKGPKRVVISDINDHHETVHIVEPETELEELLVEAEQERRAVEQEQNSDIPIQDDYEEFPIQQNRDAYLLASEDYSDGCDRLEREGEGHGPNAKVVTKDDGADTGRWSHVLRGNWCDKVRDKITGIKANHRYSGTSSFDLASFDIGKKLYVSYYWRLDPENEWKAQAPSRMAGQKHIYLTSDSPNWHNATNIYFGQGWGFDHWWCCQNNNSSEKFKFQGSAESTKTPGKWIHVEFYAELPSKTSRSDGVVAARINGQVVFYSNQVPMSKNLPDENNHRWGKLALPSMYGGGKPSEKSFGWQISDIEIWDDVPYD